MTNLRHFFTALTIAAGAMLLVGCATSLVERSRDLSLGMSQGEVTAVMGRDYEVTGMRVSPDGTEMALWEYRDEDEGRSYKVFFKDGILTEWGTGKALDDLQRRLEVED